MSLFYGLQRSLEPGDDFGLGSHVLLRPLFEIGRHLGAGGTEEPEVREDNMHVDLTGGAYARRGTPRELVSWCRFGQGNQLVRNVAPFAIVALPQAVER